jgi:hypothetical protein
MLSPAFDVLAFLRDHADLLAPPVCVQLIRLRRRSKT